VAADVLLTCGQSQGEGELAVSIPGLSDDTSWHLPQISLRAGEDAVDGAAPRGSDAEGLTLTDDDVGTPASRWLDDAKGDDVDPHD